MKLPHLSSAAGRQGGVTLIELMVSITIGLFILIAIGTAYITTTSTSRQRENQSELNEPARIVMSQLRRELSTAGYVDVLDYGLGVSAQAVTLFHTGNSGMANLYQRDPAAGYPTSGQTTPLGQFFPGLMPVFGCGGAMTSTPNAIAAAGAAVLACGGASTVRHSLQVAYQAVPSAASDSPSLQAYDPANPTGEGRDCLQQDLSAIGGAGAVYVINRYFVQTSADDGVNELVCHGSGGATARPIARGVEEFVLRYQLAAPGTAPPPGSVTPMVAAGGTQARYADAATVAASALGWSNVTAVEICMVSATSVTGGSAAAGTVELQPTRPTCTRAADGSFSPNVARVVGDQRLWKRFTSVVSVRNAVFSAPI